MPPVNQWRSLDALLDTPEFRRRVAEEFPAVTDLSQGPERRGFLRLMAASLMMAGLGGCDEEPDPRNHEVPWVNKPLATQPGVSDSFASVALIDGLANGILVTTRDGRPLKIEGNPDHPWSRGGTDVFGQASVLELYDPNRSQAVLHLGHASTWEEFRGAVTGKLAAIKASGGGGLRLLTGPLSSPLLLAQIAALQAAYPAMRWHSHAGYDRSAQAEATRRVFGKPLDPQWRFEHAKVIVAFDGDFLDPGPWQVGTSRAWAAARRASTSAGALMTLHAVGSLPSLTLAKADYPLTATPRQLVALLQGLTEDLSGPGAPAAAGAGGDEMARWRARAAQALHAARGGSLVVAGTNQPAEVHEAVHRLNAALGNVGQTVVYTAPVQGQAAPLADLVKAMHDGSVDALVMLESNPAYEAFGSLNVLDALRKVKLKIHAGGFEDETGLRADWHLPLLHPLESWGDARSPDGTVGLLQPTIAPIYDGRSASEILSLLIDQQPRTAQDLLRSHWQGTEAEESFASKWQAMLRDGFVPDSAFPAEAVTVQGSPTPLSASASQGTTVLFRPDPTVWTGRFADNPWLQELPKPLTKMVWENAVTISPAMAAREKLETGDVVTVTAGGRSMDGPVWVLPGQADTVIGLTLGYGRSVPGQIGYGLGYDANVLRDAASPWRMDNARLIKTGRSIRFATTQEHGGMEGHDFIRTQVSGGPPAGETKSWDQPTLYASKEGDGRAWGMVINLDTCIGCNACVTACQAENNIAVVGRDQVAMGREMHWLRVDRYYEGPVEAPRTKFQPVPCMHCEEAPCEVGCPVEATLHDQEGLNLMVYNRCVGTRACSGYCPYKVRHFNYLDYSAGAQPSLQLQRNPEVTVRARGVMEKCTYCVQRIVSARIASDKDNKPIPDGAVQTACQGACPTEAIVFGDLNDQGSAVLAARRDARNYALLGELNVRPKTTYLAAMAPAPDKEA